MLYIALGQPIEKRILPYLQRKASSLRLRIESLSDSYRFFFWTFSTIRVHYLSFMTFFQKKCNEILVLQSKITTMRVL
jgi:hypothetical protein